MARKTGIVRDERYLQHGAYYLNPETPARLKEVYSLLDTPDFRNKFVLIPPRYASFEDLTLVHSPNYIEMVAATEGQRLTILDPDTHATEKSYETARLAAGGCLCALEAIIEGKVDNAFAFIRPPGHHAGRDHSAGFCIFNNVAITAAHALSRLGLKRVLIVDWDLHHGDGTQEIFYRTSSVLYFSTHQYPAYPGSGWLTEIGEGEGRFYTINVPLKAFADNATYVAVFRRLLQPVARAYRPDIILVSAGFDILRHDPLGDMQVTPLGFATLTRLVMDMADECCRGRLLLVLEGGYDTEGLRASVGAVLKELLDETHVPEEDIHRLEFEAEQQRDRIIPQVIGQIGEKWPVC
ncbi:MAG TPA: histone deacetylase [Syntrophales bacterium]|nr:histone deacetylase [Syntrophales bacterium]HOL58851.1 histone deacetylase [Syntrophales bacterium]HPO35178.1 histone deacetylase [Syntrophales bacterium]